MSNHLQYETSPYLLQHKENPVDWYPWGEEAFRRAKAEDKPIFLSIGYSTCHWCHVMAHESFEDAEIADLLNRHFISIKVDKEERPDIDSIYMSVCLAFTGSGGWPTSIFMTPEQKPFFAGTYFPKGARGLACGLRELLGYIHDKWETDRTALLQQAEQVIAHLQQTNAPAGNADERLIHTALTLFRRSYDRKHGGFGGAPKFPTPHNLLFLLACHEKRGDEDCLEMAERTLLQMYRGGLFDHIGYGFSRYSTDARYLVPHFEKMLYDNALLILAYCKAYTVTGKTLYRDIAEKTAAYILREMTSPAGGFYSAQDADSDGEEGKYYVFTPEEIRDILGAETGEAFCRRFDVRPDGNFAGRSIPNLLGGDPADDSFDPFLPLLRQYRKSRSHLHLDDKILTFWNSLTIAALCTLYRVSGNTDYLDAAVQGAQFVEENLCAGDTLYVSCRDGKHGVRAFLDDYAGYIFAQLALYGATLEKKHLLRAQQLCRRVLSTFRDEAGGFYLYDAASEGLILRPKETYDGAIPSGNALMAWNLVRLSHLNDEADYAREAKLQLDFLAADAAQYPAGHAMFLLALLEYYSPSPKVTAVAKDPSDVRALPLTVSPDATLLLLDTPTEAFPLKNDRTTYYVCRDHSCRPPVNDLYESL